MHDYGIVHKHYNNKLTDKEISELTGISVNCIIGYRHRNNLPVNHKFIQGNRMELYKRGMIDKDIAEEIGVSERVIYFWRRRRNLPANKLGEKWL